jgi:xanthine dehydrogenase small subunit
MDGLRIFVNDRWVEPATPYGAPALDFIRGELGLTGTKEGCREGDCGACAVLVGEFAAAMDSGCEAGGGATAARAMPPKAARYRALPSCLLALGELDGKHLITIEGLTASAKANAEANAKADSAGAVGIAANGGLTPVMRAFLEENASQCGFCSPGFVIALTAWLASPGRPDVAGAMTAVDGNLCRCTGYGAIRRAAERLTEEFADLPQGEAARVAALVERGVLPPSALVYAAEAGQQRPRGQRQQERRFAADAQRPATALGGGTDFYVRTPDPASDFRPILLRSAEGFSGIEAIERDGQSWLRTGAAATVSDFFASPLVRRAAPGIEAFEGDFASTLIRNMATLGGNIANASPVGDLTSMLIGLGAVLEIAGWAPSSPAARYVRIEEFFLGYKKIDLRPGEAIRAILIPAERDGSPLLFSFEKIAKRKKLDIAAVNTALSFRIEGGFARAARLSAGGVAAVPGLLKGASASLEGERIDRSDPAALARLARKVAAAAEAEVKPIGDVRGSAEYRKRMTGRLVLAHFVRLFAADGIAKELFP